MQNHLRRNVVGLIWLIGLLCAVVVYRVGPDRILYSVADVIENFRAYVDDLLSAFAVNTFDVMRALAIGLMPAFIAFCVIAHRRGLPAMRSLVVVSVLWLLLLYQPVRYGEPVSAFRWTVAFLAVGIGCLVVARHLSHDPRDRTAPPYPSWPPRPQ
ncbi:MAG TPA: hypothetical protein VHS58_04785 [Acetobacteraceae bacterium]|jgi:hypothetical protein|nr:hypothetical protein [Acetobacteraceae bacterium]